MVNKISPFAPKSYPDFKPISGVKMATAEASIKYKNRDDVTLFALAENTTIAAVFTTSLTCGINVEIAKENLKKTKIARAIIITAGNANTFNGASGVDSYEAITTEVADLLNCKQEEVFFSATGVIGAPFPKDKVVSKLTEIIENLGDNKWFDAANAIRTTDTFAKLISLDSFIGEKQVKITGIAKGSGMIAPNMATMLVYIFTDAAIDAEVLQNMLNEATQTTFNAITVDSDTSTSDTVLFCATGAAGNKKITDIKDKAIAQFKKDFEEVCFKLSQMVVTDGEGLTKLVEVEVKGAKDDKAAHNIAMSIANSPLVKTAISGEDANWGRVIMAIGKAGEEINKDKIKIIIGPELILEDSEINPNYNEDNLTSYMQGNTIKITVDVSVGDGVAKVWGNDLTHEYIDINGSYRS